MQVSLALAFVFLTINYLSMERRMQKDRMP
jgi:hypothetical protein